MAAIPGGPEDHTPPALIGVKPDTNAVNFHGDAVDFKFDEVVSDRSGPTSDLNGLFLISPRDGAPRIDWHRDHIDVKPKGKFRPNTAYTVTLLPGLADLSGNISKKTFSYVFTTGATLPKFGVLGRVFDWSAQRIAPAAVVEAISEPDSVVYVDVADSTGQFHLGPFGPGKYAVVAYVDQNHNMRRDLGEIWDSTQVNIETTQPYLEMLAAKRDTVGPIIATVAEDDSLDIRVTVDKPLNPAVALDTSMFHAVTGDSVHLTLTAVRTLAQRDTDVAREKALQARIADSLAALRDTTKRGKPVKPPAPPRPAAVDSGPPKPSKPAPATVVILTLADGSKLPPEIQVRVTATNLENLLGYKGTSTRVFATPKPPAKADSTAKTPGDTSKVKTPPDTSKVKPRPDSTAKPPLPKKPGGGGGGEAGGGGR